MAAGTGPLPSPNLRMALPGLLATNRLVLQLGQTTRQPPGHPRPAAAAGVRGEACAVGGGACLRSLGGHPPALPLTKNTSGLQVSTGLARPSGHVSHRHTGEGQRDAGGPRQARKPPPLHADGLGACHLPVRINERTAHAHRDPALSPAGSWRCVHAPAGVPTTTEGPTGARSGPTPSGAHLCPNGPAPWGRPICCVGAGVWLITSSFTLLHKPELAGLEGRGRLAGDATHSLRAQTNREDPPSAHACVSTFLQWAHGTVLKDALLLLLCLVLQEGHLVLKFMQKKKQTQKPEKHGERRMMERGHQIVNILSHSLGTGQGSRAVGARFSIK